MERFQNPNETIQDRIDDLISKMTLEEMVSQMDMVRGVEFATKVHPAHFCSIDDKSDFDWESFDKTLGTSSIGFIHDSYSSPKQINKLQRHVLDHSRLPIPVIFTGEALHGISYPGATIFPMPIAMAASFDRQTVYQTGCAIAEEARSIGISEILAPNLDVAREPRWGRMEETFGEDTYLSSEMAYQIISGEQGNDVSQKNKVVCEPKHYCVHAIPESGLNCSHARVGQREVETNYLPVFESGIRKAGAYNAMACYNAIDSELVISSKHYLTDILKDRLGLKGYIRADFGAIARQVTMHRTTEDQKTAIERSVNAGLDVQGFDYPNEFWQTTILALIKENRIPIERIHDAVRRILYVKFKLGLFEQPYVEESLYSNILRSKKNKDISYKIAQESIVMLKNKGVLPINKNKIKSIAVIGPSAGTQRIGSYSSTPYGYSISTVADEVRKEAGSDIIVKECDACAISERAISLLPQHWYQGEIKAEFYNNMDFGGKCVSVEHYPAIDFNWILSKPHRDLSFTGYSARFTGSFRVDTNDFCQEDHFHGKLLFTTNDSVRVKIDDCILIDSMGNYKMRVPETDFLFENGKVHTFEIEYICDVNGANVTLSLESFSNRFDEAVQIVQECDLTLFVCGDDTTTSGEGMDRDEITLYGPQRKLFEKISKTEKPIVFILEIGKATDISRESESADAILVPWFGGEFGAKAITDVLFGRISPSGKLPVSFPKNIGQLPMYYSRLQGGHEHYLNGSNAALYPFGHGLSYAEFDYRDFIVEKKSNYEMTVSCRITNKSERKADEVVQLYLNDVDSSIVTPMKLLKGFERVSLNPRESKLISFSLDFDSFKLLNREYQWVVEEGEFILMIGSSSEDIRMKKKIII